MKTLKNILLILLFLACHKTIPKDYYNETIDTAQKIDGKMTIISQVVYSYRKSDSLLIAKLTRLNNYDDDYFTSLTYGIKKTDGLKDCYVDSTFYDKKGNDTISIIYSHWKSIWERTQTLTKKFNTNNKVEYSKTLDPKNPRYLHQTFYKYNNKNQLYSETVFECPLDKPCDSIQKTIYYYDINGNQDSISFHRWEDQQWK